MGQHTWRAGDSGVLPRHEAACSSISDLQHSDVSSKCPLTMGNMTHVANLPSHMGHTIAPAAQGPCPLSHDLSRRCGSLLSLLDPERSLGLT